MHRKERNQLIAGAAALLGLGAGLHLLDGWLHTNPLAASLIGAVVVDLVGGRLGLKWSDQEGLTARLKGLAFLRGFGSGIGIALAVVVVAALLRWTTVTRGSPSIVGLALGFAAPLALAARDELLFRGLPMALARGRVKDRWLLPFVALLGAAPIVLQPGATLIGVVLAVCSGGFHAVCWRLGRGAWIAWGAHAGWSFMAGAGVHGVLLDAWFNDGVLVPAARAHGAVAWLAALLFAIAALGSLHWASRPRSPK
ncbi:MAG TPA: hypothetical protein PLI95_21065 [Polyangiaceae bacterium]|nr:hypothetical protein [Polyangiaceae bacterium]